MIGAIFGPNGRKKNRRGRSCRNPLCDRGYLRTYLGKRLRIWPKYVAIPFVIGAIFGPKEGDTVVDTVYVAIPFVIGAIFGHIVFLSPVVSIPVAIPFVIGAIFGPMGGGLSVRLLPGRNPLCDRGYLRTNLERQLAVQRVDSRNPLCDRGYLRTYLFDFAGKLAEESQSPL